MAMTAAVTTATGAAMAVAATVAAAAVLMAVALDDGGFGGSYGCGGGDSNSDSDDGGCDGGDGIFEGGRWTRARRRVTNNNESAWPMMRAVMKRAVRAMAMVTRVADERRQRR